MKKTVVLFSAALLSLSLAGCGSNNHDHAKKSADVKTSQTSHSHRKVSEKSASSASQSSAERSSASSTSTSSEQHVINTADDAARLVAHAMAAEDSLYHAVPASGGFEVTRSDTDQKAFVSYDGSVTWDDGTTQSYSDVSAPENNDRVNSTFAPSGN